MNQKFKYNTGKQILGKNTFSSMNDLESRLNNNVMLLGSPGSGKTTLIKANLLEATGSYIVSDPKSQLYGEFKEYLENHGYRVLCLDFKNLLHNNTCHFNPFSYIRNEEDILKISTLLSGDCRNKNDPFWDQAVSLLYTSLISYLVLECDESKRTLRNMISMISMGASTRNEYEKSELDILFDKLADKKPDSYAVRQYQRYRGMASKTLLSVLITAQSKLAFFDTPTINELTSIDDINIPSIGQKPTALFVSVSDTDRSLDSLAGLFFSIAIQELVRYADETCENGRLRIPTRIFMDDFGTNIKIEQYPRILSSIRSRNISTWTILQSKGQLEKIYGNDADTIIGACDHVIYQGGNDIVTARYIADRTNNSISSILGMEIGKSIIVTRGERESSLVDNIEMNKYILNKN